MTKWVYSFGDGRAEGEAGMRNLLGGKGANLGEMVAAKLPVPPGFVLLRTCYRDAMHHGGVDAELAAYHALGNDLHLGNDPLPFRHLGHRLGARQLTPKRQAQGREPRGNSCASTTEPRRSE